MQCWDTLKTTCGTNTDSETRSAPRRSPGALPDHQNQPRKPAYGLYTEGINGTPFTVRRDENRKLWLYRVTAEHDPQRV